MGTVTFPSIISTLIEPPANETLTIGTANFPETDSVSSRSTASFGNSVSFINRSTRQEVTTSTATIIVGVTIVGVNFNGPVTLTFADGEVNLSDIYIVDEGGFCSDINTITATSTSASGSLVISSPYGNMRARTNGTDWFAEVSSTVVNPDGSTTTENEDGSNTVVSSDGTSVTTSADGNTTFTINPDGSTVEATVSGNTTSSTTILADGTEIVAEEASNGNSTSFTTYPDGTTVDSTASQNGNTSSVTVSPDGTVETESAKANGSVDVSTIYPDGSTYSFIKKTNGKVTITTVDASGTEVVEVYLPSEPTYTQTTTPPATVLTLSPNPFQV